MAVLAPPIHIKATPGECIRYIQDPEKVIAESQTGNVMRYMQSHCIEDIASVGYNGCSGIRELAVEQFRLAEAKYQASHPARVYEEQEISVLRYLEKNRKSKLPKKLKPIPPADCKFDMTLEHAMRVWRNTTRSEEERERARDVLEAYTVKPKLRTPTLAEHLVISFHKEDNPTPEQVQAVVDKFMQHPYFTEPQHLAVSNIHWNTDEKHCHVLVQNTDVSGARRLSLSCTKLRELRRYLDHICYEQGLSIVDTKEGRLDPEHARWLDEVKAEGKIKVWPEKNIGQGWKADHDRKVAALEARFDRSDFPPALKAEVKDFARNDLFFTDNNFINMTPRPLTVAELQKYSEEAKKRRNKETEAANRRQRAREEEQWRYFYCVRIYVYDQALHRYRQRSLLELIFILARLIITQDSNFLEDYYPKRYSEMSAVWNSPINRRIQNMIDAGNTARELNIRTPDELKRRVEKIGADIGETRKAIRLDERTIERGQTLFAAIQTWQDKEQPESARKEAYHTMAAYKTTTDEAIADFLERYTRAQRRLPEKEEFLNNLNRDYRNAKKAYETLLVLNEQCREVNTAAREAAKQKPELDAIAKAAAQRSGTGNEREKTTEWGNG